MTSTHSYKHIPTPAHTHAHMHRKTPRRQPNFTHLLMSSRSARTTSLKTNMSWCRRGEQSEITYKVTRRIFTAPHTHFVIHTHTVCMHACVWHAHTQILYNSTPALCNCWVVERAHQATPPLNQGLLEAMHTAFFFPLPLFHSQPPARNQSYSPCTPLTITLFYIHSFFPMCFQHYGPVKHTWTRISFYLQCQSHSPRNTFFLIIQCWKEEILSFPMILVMFLHSKYYIILYDGALCNFL